MGVTDWEPRALPSRARCQRWYEQGGRLLVTWASGLVGTLESLEGSFIGPSETVRVRPWKDNNPATWSDFYAATHPPIPEGLERIGEWRTGLGAPRDLPLVFLEDGTIMRDPGLILGSVWFCEVRRILPAIPEGWEQLDKWKYRDAIVILLNEGERLLMQDGQITRGGDVNGWCTVVRRVPPPADWGDVPRGVELDADRGGAMLVTSDGHAVTHGIVWFSAGVWHSGNVSERADQRHPSLPAAIVALTGRRDE